MAKDKINYFIIIQLLFIFYRIYSHFYILIHAKKIGNISFSYVNIFVATKSHACSSIFSIHSLFSSKINLILSPAPNFIPSLTGFGITKPNDVPYWLFADGRPELALSFNFSTTLFESIIELS